MNQELVDILRTIGLGEELGREQGGFPTPPETDAAIMGIDRAAAVSVMDDVPTFMSRVEPVTIQVLSAIAPFVGEGRAHEILHCLDVGLGAAELAQQLANDTQARQKLGLPEITEDDIAGAFLAGLAHDAALSLTLEGLGRLVPEASLIERVTAGEVKKFTGKPPYNKDVIGDDLRGAVMLGSYGFHSGARDVAVRHLLAGSDLKTQTTGEKPRVLPYKVLDAIWYHDGNYPIRGHAEADTLVGDRVRLFREGRVDENVVGAGIDKLLGYTEQDPAWEARDKKPDTAYLTKWIAKKAGGFLEAVEGTGTYAFVVDELAARGRSARALRSPAFWAGVDRMPGVLETAMQDTRIRGAFGKKIDLLHQRYEEVQQYRPRR